MATVIQPSGELWWKIRIELNEDVNTRDRDLEAIKEWLRKQPHLPDEWDDGRMLTFLRGCSFSMEKCKRKLDMYFTMRAACPEFFANRDINRPELREVLTKGQGGPMPGLTPEGRRVVCARALDKNLTTPQIIAIFKVVLMVGDIRLKEESEGLSGEVYVLDASVVSPSHLGKLPLTLLKKFLICVQEAYPVKLKEIHIINAPPIIDTAYGLVKPFLKEKIRNRVHIHREIDTIYKFVPKSLVPVEFGGDGISLAELSEAWAKKLEDYKDWFKEQESLMANEALRPGEPTNYDELFGLDGSFRQLSID